MNRKCYANRGKKVCNIWTEMNGLTNNSKQEIVNNLLHDFEAHQSDRQSDLEERKRRTINAIRQQYQSLVSIIPSDIQNLTIDEIITSGGSVELNDSNNNEIEIQIRKSLLRSNANNDMSEAFATNRSRHAFNDMSAAINAVSGQKKNAFNSSNKAMALKLPLIGSSLSNSANKTSRLLRSATKLQTITNTNTYSKQNKSKARVLRTAEKTKPENSVIKESKSQTINTNTDSNVFKTPFEKSLSLPFTKPARKPLENEKVIKVFCSTSGTPLLIDGKSAEQLVNISDES